MFRLKILVVLALLVLASTAEAGRFGRRGRHCCQTSCSQQTYHSQTQIQQPLQVQENTHHGHVQQTSTQGRYHYHAQGHFHFSSRGCSGGRCGR